VGCATAVSLGAALAYLTTAEPLTAGGPIEPLSAVSAATATVAATAPAAAVCFAEPGPEYYAFDLFTTKNIPGTGLATGKAEVAVSGSSPFSVALGPDGSYRYDVHVSLQRMKAPREGRLVAWVTTTEIDRIERLGALDDALTAAGTVEWNKFIVVVTLESTDDPDTERWSGPVVMRGMSRSGMMHTMVGHGALQQENCGAYGYGN